ncbi:photosynthetic complex assembly protein PuhC [Pararhodospirillum oryzae]|uniref:Photosynthetic complex assembly protein n=1 Tax=Pararhodospirillum oryzae TaxID=478448 RepID=A0A512H515_9PROT|nr:photosynthetic complex assembly protein PuhC [Pararhodospirillum oryzae]GEO80518.1 hypothetical protein ROR02_06490 [Pararhodospirillum oryzae]
MGDPFEDKPVPRSALIAAAIVVSLTILVAAWARLSGYDPGSDYRSAVVATEDMAFRVENDGTVAVIVPPDNVVMTRIPAASSGFLQGILKSLERERHRREIDLATPYRLERHANGRLALADPGTGMNIDVGSFGPTSLALVQDLFQTAHDRRRE